jgi:hypothetical protein
MLNFSLAQITTKTKENKGLSQTSLSKSLTEPGLKLAQWEVVCKIIKHTGFGKIFEYKSFQLLPA